LLAEGESYWLELKTSVAKAKVNGAQVHDARVAALCRTHGVRELWTADRDFSRFPNLRTRNPLV
jgi:predicted nucleic acid-binding protein